MKNTKKKSNALMRLSCAALALPGLMSAAHAGRVDETYNADFQYGHYDESGKRISVDIFESALSAPIGKSMTANLSILRDIISGASAVYNTRNSRGVVSQVMSGASGAAATSRCGYSICEQRDAINGGLAYYFDKAALSVGGGYSREHDYISRYGNTNLSIDLNKKLTTLNFGGSLAFDEVAPTEQYYYSVTSGGQLNQSQIKHYKTSQQYLAGITQVIDKDSLWVSNMTFATSNGFLSDPYKHVTFEDGANNFVALPFDKRPSNKFQWAWLNQYVRHFGNLNNAALHVDYRFTSDSWGTNSHTAELSWHQPIVDDWQVIPRFRYYSQDRADFYQDVFTGSPTQFDYYSSDYRLAGFGTLSGGAKLSKEVTKLKGLNSLKFQAGFEYFKHQSSFQLGGNGGGNFADFGYYLVTTSFNLKF